MAQGFLWATVALLVVVALVSLDVMGFAFWKGNKFPLEGRTVILTGASQGMGKELAKLLSQRGASIVLVARDVEKLRFALEYAKAAAKNPTAQRFHFISADVTSESENARLLVEATAWNNGQVPEVVWANAGSSTPGLYVETSTETLRKQMDINYWAAAYLAHQTLQAWLYPETPYPSQEKGSKPEPQRHLIITSSAVAFVGLAGYGPYAPAKAALRSLCDTLRCELLLYNGARRSKNASTGQAAAPFDINIQTIFPGTIKSPGFENENKTKHAVTFELEASDPEQTELQAATAAIRGLENGNFMTPTNWLIELLRLGMLGGAPKDNLIKDIVGQWLASIVWLFAGPDMESKVWGYGKREGMPKFKKNAQ